MTEPRRYKPDDARNDPPDDDDRGWGPRRRINNKIMDDYREDVERNGGRRNVERW